MTPALVIGHPATLVVSLLLIPVIIVFAVFLKGNQFLPLASLAGLFYLFPLILPITKGNVFKTFIIGLIILVAGLYITTNLAPAFTKAAVDVCNKTSDPTVKASVKIPDGFSDAAALDFASTPFSWAIYHLTTSFKLIGSIILVIITMGLMIWNRLLIVKEGKIHALKAQEQMEEETKLT
jgi:PTS system galactitol-specific IIC component